MYEGKNPPGLRGHPSACGLLMRISRAALHFCRFLHAKCASCRLLAVWRRGHAQLDIMLHHTRHTYAAKCAQF